MTNTRNDLLELTTKELKLAASMLPKYPPLKPSGDVSVKEMLPDLTNKELDTVMKYYTGTMDRG